MQGQTLYGSGLLLMPSQLFTNLSESAKLLGGILCLCAHAGC